MDKEKYPSKERMAEAHSGTEVSGEMFKKDGMNFSKRGSRAEMYKLEDAFSLHERGTGGENPGNPSGR